MVDLLFCFSYVADILGLFWVASGIDVGKDDGLPRPACTEGLHGYRWLSESHWLLRIEGRQWQSSKNDRILLHGFHCLKAVS